MNINIIFGYKIGPSYGRIGDYGGFSVNIFSNGIIEYKTYIFCDKEQSREIYSIDDVNLEKIKWILSSYGSEISNIPNKLYNGTCDGNGNAFIFMDKEITCWNIQYADIEEVKDRNPQYYEIYRANIQYENTTLDIFEEVTKVLEVIDIKLSLYSIKFMKS